jgi:tRNA(adenine34) deaminase
MSQWTAGFRLVPLTLDVIPLSAGMHKTKAIALFSSILGPRACSLLRRHIHSNASLLLRCLDLAEQAGRAGDVPVGAVIASSDGTMLGSAQNRSMRDSNTTAHAELLAMAAACVSLGSSRLDGLTLYVSLEPCVMCFGAALLHKLDRIVYAAPSPKFGAISCGVGDVLRGRYNHELEIIGAGGTEGATSAALLRAFFKARRGGESATSGGLAHLQLPVTSDLTPHAPPPTSAGTPLQPCICRASLLRPSGA